LALGGTIFEMSPASGGWTFQVLYNLTGGGSSVGPSRNLALDAAGNLYGTTYSEGAFGRGSVFKLSPGSGGWPTLRFTISPAATMVAIP
jgi:uncharacterized repeat protein (TIGR03803 family)